MSPRTFPRAFPPLIAVTLAAVAAAQTAEPSADEVRQRLGVQRGLIVQVGATDGSLAIGLAKPDPVIVFAVAADAKGAAAVRERLVTSGLHGQATAGSLVQGRIPLIDNLAAGLVADLDARLITREEAMRVLRPDGKALLRQAGAWQVVTKPRPADIDDWGQYHHDAAMSDVSNDRQVGPAYGLQWVSGPQTAQNEGFRIAGSICVQQGGADPAGLRQWLVARDAFSGLPLWTRQDLKPASRYALILDRERVYLYPESKEGGNGLPAPCMIALDARTGETVLEYREGITFEAPADLPADRKQAEPVVRGIREQSTDFMARLTDDGLLVQTADRQLVVLDARTGKRLWRAEADEGMVWVYPVVADGVVHVIEGRKVRSPSYTHWPTPQVVRIRALGLRDGRERWRYNWPEAKEPIAAHNMVKGGGKLALLVRQPAVGKGQIKALVLDAATGKEIYFDSNEVVTGDMGAGHSGGRILAVKDRLWFTTITVIGGSISLEDPADSSRWEKTYKKMPRPVGCTAYRATPNWLFGSLTAYALEGGEKLHHTDVARTSCDVGAFPANGMNYLMPNGCFCQPYLPGSTAFHSRKFAGEEEIARLEKGAAGAAPARPGTGWPTFLRAGDRSNWTTEPVPAALAQGWTQKLAGEPPPALLANLWDNHWYAQGPVTGASVAEGVAVVALSHRQQIVALDPATGRTLWRQSVDGRVDTAPTIHQGLVLAGTRNGWLYALNRDTGAVVWQFFCAPRREQLVADGQLESPWPLFGTVAVNEAGIFAIAGRHTDSDGGMWWWQLDPASGKPLHRGRLGNEALKTETSGGGTDGIKAISGANQPPVLHGKRILLPGMAFELADGELKPWTPPKTGRSEQANWRAQFDTGWIVPGNQGILHRIGAVSGYKMNAYGFTLSRMYAVNGDRFVMVGGPVAFANRGGQSNSQLRYLRRLPAIATDELADAKDPAKKQQRMRGSELLWEHPALNLVRGDGLKSMAVAGDVVLSAIEVTNRDRHKERAEMPFRLQVHRLQDGELREEHPLSARPILGGVTSDDGRAFVVAEDGSLTCFAAKP
jgi:outer membrane protein assembly factor BamB